MDGWVLLVVSPVEWINDVTKGFLTNREIIGGRYSKGMRPVTWLGVLEGRVGYMGRKLGQKKKLERKRWKINIRGLNKMASLSWMNSERKDGIIPSREVQETRR